jgi:hypothetical protein
MGFNSAFERLIDAKVNSATEWCVIRIFSVHNGVILNDTCDKDVEELTFPCCCIY